MKSVLYRRMLPAALLTWMNTPSSTCCRCRRLLTNILQTPRQAAKAAMSTTTHNVGDQTIDVTSGSSGSQQEIFKKVMRIVPQPVVVVTTSVQQNGGEWIKRGVTCSSFTSISVNPPIISFAMNRPSRIHDLLLQSGTFVVHVLAENQVGHALHFSKPAIDGQDQFENIPHELDPPQGTATLRDTCAVLHCQRHSVSDIGDHHVWYGRVIHAYKNNIISQSPLLHYSRGFRSVGDETFLQAFESQTLPFEEWTHMAHLRMAWSYIRELGKDAAAPVIRNGIKKYNKQNKDKISRGYHETVTMFYINIVAEAVRQSSDTDETFEEFVEKNAHITDKGLLFEYYSDKVINSKAAYNNFLAPDKKPLPQIQ